jgi:hypothetical protein
MKQESTMGISIKYESGIVFRGTRPLEEILDELKEMDIPHVSIDPAQQKYGNWNLVIAFNQQENYQKFSFGELTIPGYWFGSEPDDQRKVNPLKASKRAAGAKG